MSTFNVLCIGDVVGKLGRKALDENLSRLQTEYRPLFTVVNIENAAGGFGVTHKIYKHFLKLNIDVFTSGNHIFDKREIMMQFNQYHALIRPLNFPEGSPGEGVYLLEKEGITLCVMNAIGRVFMNLSDCPFQKIKKALINIRNKTPYIILDFHAETTSEKQAMGWFLDGQVSGVYGTHTHVQTADERLLPSGTGYITDVGMTGAYDSIIGMTVAPIVKKFQDQLPVRFEPPSEGASTLNAICFTIDKNTGKSVKVSRINEIYQ